VSCQDPDRTLYTTQVLGKTILDDLTFCEGCHQGEDEDGEHSEVDAGGRPHGECRQKPAKKNKTVLMKIFYKLQSNLCIATTLGTRKKWSLFRGGRYSEVQLVKLFFLIKNFISETECRA
jgi:hypothetical protein